MFQFLTFFLRVCGELRDSLRVLYGTEDKSGVHKTSYPYVCFGILLYVPDTFPVENLSIKFLNIQIDFCYFHFPLIYFERLKIMNFFPKEEL